jgi:Gas vesicle synthesis protein GvpL/GvpF
MTEAGLGWYVYCVVRQGEQPSLTGLSGVDPDFDVEVLTHAGLSALVSRVRLDEFGAEALRRNLEDLAWVERTARAHDLVIGRALEAEPLVPLRLCTIFDDETHVREMLERENEVLLQALDRLRGHAEWSVKVLVDSGKLEEAVRERTRAAAGAGGAETESPGRAYFATKKADRSLREEADAIAAAATEDAHSRLQRHAAAATLLRPQNPKLSGRSGQMLLNGAYLVERSRADEFATLVNELRDRHREIGLDFDLSGPWAPYNFVPGSEASHGE